MHGKLVHELKWLVRVRVWGWVRVRALGYGFGVRGRKVKSRDCSLASDLVLVRAGLRLPT